MACFIGYTKESSDKPDIKTAPKWCPRKMAAKPMSARKIGHLHLQVNIRIVLVRSFRRRSEGGSTIRREIYEQKRADEAGR